MTHLHSFPPLLLLTLLSGCSVYDIQQLFTPPNSVLLIRQNEQGNTLNVTVEGETRTQLNGVRVDPKQIPVTPSQSLAVDTRLIASLPVASSSSLVTSLEEAQKTLIRTVALVETQPERVELLLAEAQRLAQSYPDDALLQSLWQRLSRYSDWQPVNSIINNAGIDFITVQGWQPESPFIRTRRALLPPVANDEQVIFADQRLVLLMNNEVIASLHIDARLDDIPFLPESPTQLRYQVDDQPSQSLILADKDDWRSFTLTIPTGEHVVRFYQQQPVGNQYVKLRFNETGGVLAVAQERPYFISTAATPLTFYSQGPSILRIDELHEGVVSYRYQNVPDGWQTISLPPPEGKARSLLRVSQRVVNLHPEPLRNRINLRTLKPVATPEAIKVRNMSPTDKVELIDAFKLGKQEDGTLSVGGDVVRRINRQSTSANVSEVEQFAQYRMNYRYYDEPRDTYWNTLGFFHVREFGGPTLGFDEFVYFNPDWLPFTVRSDAKVVAQYPANQLEWFAQWNLVLAKSYNIHPKTSLIPSLMFFMRAMSLQNSVPARTDPIYRLKIDQDVFTPYKADHQIGLIPALTLQHKPWLDTIWSATIMDNTNPDLDPTHADHYSAEGHWRQLLGEVELDASYIMTFYQQTIHRNIAQNRSFVGLNLNWQHWTSYQNRLEVDVQYSYDLEYHNQLGMLSFTYHFGEGRGYRDFAPNEIDFRDIRQRQIVDEQNNVMRDVSH